MWFIDVEVEQETSAPPPKNNPGSAPAACLKTNSFGTTKKRLKQQVDDASSNKTGHFICLFI